MVLINFAKKLVTCKIVYYGPGLSGKTTNLEVIYDKIPDNRKGQLTSIKTQGVGGAAGDRTLFFDYLPLELGKVAGMTTRFQMFTVPGQVYYNSTRKLVLQNVDGIVFVADSSRAKLAENHESFKNLLDNLREYNLSIRKVPLVMQWNKRDLPDAMEIKELEEELNIYNFPSVEAVATTGKGVFPTLKQVASMVLDNLNSQQIEQRARPERSSARGPKSPEPRSPASAAEEAPIQVDRRQESGGRRMEDRAAVEAHEAPAPEAKAPEAEPDTSADAQPTLQMERPARPGQRQRGPRSPEPKSPLPAPATEAPAAKAAEPPAPAVAAPDVASAALPKGDASDWDIDTKLSAKPTRKGVGSDIVIPGLGESDFDVDIDLVRSPDDEPTKIGKRPPSARLGKAPPKPAPAPEPKPEEYEIAVDAPMEMSPEEAAAMLAAELGEPATAQDDEPTPVPAEEPLRGPAEQAGEPDEDTITVDVDDLEPSAPADEAEEEAPATEATEEIGEADLEPAAEEDAEEAEAEVEPEVAAEVETEELEVEPEGETEELEVEPEGETAKADESSEDLEVEDLDLDATEAEAEDLDIEAESEPAEEEAEEAAETAEDHEEAVAAPAKPGKGPKAPPKKRKLGAARAGKGGHKAAAEDGEIDEFEDSEDAPPPPKKKSRALVLIVIVLVLAAATICALDYTKVLDLGIFEMLGL